MQFCVVTNQDDWYYVQYTTEKCRYDDLIDKSEEPEYTCDLRYESERPVGEYKRCPGIVRVLLKRLIGDFNVYGNHYDMMRHSPIARQYDDVTKGMTRKERI